jgi:hypothetical protein
MQWQNYILENFKQLSTWHVTVQGVVSNFVEKKGGYFRKLLLGMFRIKPLLNNDTLS